MPASRAEPEPDQVELGRPVAAHAESEAQLRLVGECCGIQIRPLSLHTVDCLRANVWKLRYEHPVGSPEVRLGVVRRHRALIAPEELDPAPVHTADTRLRAEQRVYSVRCGPARQGDSKDAVGLDRSPGGFDESIGGL